MGRVIGTEGGKINKIFLQGLQRLIKGQSIPQPVLWPSALGFSLMLSELDSAGPGLVLWQGELHGGVTSASLGDRTAAGPAQPLPALPPLLSQQSCLSSRWIYSPSWDLGYLIRL